MSGPGDPGPAGPPTGDSPRARVLLVEDESTMRFMLEQALRLEGYEVHPARSAEEAEAVVSGQAVDLVVCDLNLRRMGDREGVRLAGALRAMLPAGTRFVAYSGDPDLESVASEFDAAVAKGAGLRALIEALDG